MPDRHVHDRTGPLDRVALLDAAVIAEDDDTDVVGFQVQRHAAQATRKFDHFAGLDIVEAVDTRNAVADRQHLPDLGDLRFLAEILDLLLEDGRNLGGLDVHQRTSFMRVVRVSSLVRSELSIMRLPMRTTRPPSRAGSTRISILTFWPGDVPFRASSSAAF